jgi:hypothetical protein
MGVSQDGSGVSREGDARVESTGQFFITFGGTDVPKSLGTVLRSSHTFT